MLENPDLSKNQHLAFLDQLRCLCLLVKGASLQLGSSDTDDLTRDVVPLGQGVQGVTRDELLAHLPFERDAVSTVSRHDFHRPELIP